MHTNIKLIERRICKISHYKGKAVGFNIDKVKLINSRTTVREYLNHPGAVAVLPILADNRIVMVKQYRYPVRELTLEIPAGKMHGKKDSPIKRVKAELKEETGYTAKSIEKILSFNPCNAFSNEILHIYIAKNLKKGAIAPDADEFLKVVNVPLSRALQLVRTGKIKDAKTIIALLWYNFKIASQLPKKNLQKNKGIEKP